MKKILITGATGNIGSEVIHYLFELENELEVVAAVRDVGKAKVKFSDFQKLLYVYFDFENPDSYSGIFEKIDVLFLLRPPQISEVDKYFKPLLISAKAQGVGQIVFLSVQGVERSRAIPHNKIESLIKSMGFRYIFVRPSYFMQNLTTTLLPEIKEKQTITLPSGKAKFNWIDTRNIGEATAELINSFGKFQNRAYEITGSENENFYYVTQLMSEITGMNYNFKSLNPISFFFKKKSEKGISGEFALVMTLLHFLPRLQSEPEISDWFQKLTGKQSTTLREFVEREKRIIMG